MIVECMIEQLDGMRPSELRSNKLRGLSSSIRSTKTSLQVRFAQRGIAARRAMRADCTMYPEPVATPGGENPPGGTGGAANRKKSFVGDDLLSHAVARILPSALAGLTTGFEMDPGVPLPPISPTKLFYHIV